jgi:hypothetical protein
VFSHSLDPLLSLLILKSPTASASLLPDEPS